MHNWRINQSNDPDAPIIFLPAGDEGGEKVRASAAELRLAKGIAWILRSE